MTTYEPVGESTRKYRRKLASEDAGLTVWTSR